MPEYVPCIKITPAGFTSATESFRNLHMSINKKHIFIAQIIKVAQRQLLKQCQCLYSGNSSAAPNLAQRKIKNKTTKKRKKRKGNGTFIPRC